jgi:CheY-like chemotaxis protein
VRVRARLPALVLLDVLIDGRTGFDLCRLLRERHTAAELPIVLGCHVYQGAEHEAEAERAGAQAWLSLPVEPEDLLSLVASLTRERHGVRAA